MKKLGLFVAALSLLALPTGCNKDIFDFNYTFDKAIVSVNGITKTFEIDSWTDYEGEQLQIELKDGTVMLVSSYNCVLMSSKGEDVSGYFESR